MIAKLRIVFYLAALVVGLSSPVAYGQAQETNQFEDMGEFLSIEWEDLMSRADLDAILNAPPMSHDLYGWEEQLGDDPEQDAYRKALQSFDVNPEMLNKRVMIPGFIVPTAYNEQRLITEFFLVPFFGACIHLPPPPPNQIIHVKYPEGLPLDNYYEPHAVLGALNSEVVRNDLADSAYSMEAEGVEVFIY